MALIDALKRSYASAKRKNWSTLYICIDLHDTVVRSNYDINKLPTEFISEAKQVLQMLSNRKDIVLIMYTCSHLSEIVKYQQFFHDNDIHFKHVNENPEVPDNALGCYTYKLYFNLLFEDKSGFNAETDWTVVKDFFLNAPELE